MQCELAGKKIWSHGAGVVLYRTPEPNRLEIAAMDYSREKRTTVRAFMGKQGFGPGGRPETFSETIDRELRAEAFDISIPYRVGYEIKGFVYRELVPDDEDPSTRLHFKGFLAADFKEGRLRDHRLIEHDGTAKEEILAPPQWVEVGELLRRMSQRGATVFSHHKAVVGTLHRLAERSSVLALRYGSVLEATESLVVTPSQEELTLVREYLESLDKEAVNGK